MEFNREMIQKYEEEHAEICRKTGTIDIELYDKYGVKRGLRDKNGKACLQDLQIYPK